MLDSNINKNKWYFFLSIILFFHLWNLSFKFIRGKMNVLKTEIANHHPKLNFLRQEINCCQKIKKNPHHHHRQKNKAFFPSTQILREIIQLQQFFKLGHRRIFCCQIFFCLFILLSPIMLLNGTLKCLSLKKDLISLLL